MTDTPDPGTSQPSPPPPPSDPAAAPPPGKPDIGKRAVAAIIDAVVAMVIGFIPMVGGIVATAYWLVRDGLEVEFMDRRSLGKKLMKLRPVTLDGSPMDIMTSVKRNWMFALGGLAGFLAMTIIGLVVAIPLGLIAFVLGIIEAVLVVTDAEGRRIGDKTGNTRVIETET